MGKELQTCVLRVEAFGSSSNWSCASNPTTQNAKLYLALQKDKKACIKRGQKQYLGKPKHALDRAAFHFWRSWRKNRTRITLSCWGNYQQHVNIVWFSYDLQFVYVSPKTNKRPTKCRHKTDRCQLLVGIGSRSCAQLLNSHVGTSNLFVLVTFQKPFLRAIIRHFVAKNCFLTICQKTSG